MQRIVNNVSTLLNDKTTTTDNSESTTETTTEISTITSKIKNAKFNGKHVYSLDKLCPFCGNGLLTTESDEDEEETITVKAENVITNYEMRFVTDELKKKIQEVISNYMSAEKYDSDKDGIVNKSKVSETVEKVTWDEIQNKPNINNIQEFINKSHSHSNIASLNKINQNTKELPTWNGKEWPYPIKNENYDYPLNQPSYKNLIITNDINTSSNVNIGDIWLETKNVDDVPIITSINVKLTSTQWASISINDILVRAINEIKPVVYNIIEETQIVNHEDMGNIQGGELNDHYHLTKSEYNQFKELLNSNIIDQSKYYLNEYQYNVLKEMIDEYVASKS